MEENRNYDEFENEDFDTDVEDEYYYYDEYETSSKDNGLLKTVGLLLAGAAATAVGVAVVKRKEIKQSIDEKRLLKSIKRLEAAGCKVIVPGETVEAIEEKTEEVEEAKNKKTENTKK